MRLNLVGGLIAALIIAALIAAYGTLFTVYQTRQALVVRLGSPLRVITEPGLHVKAPIFDSVINIDKRILDLETRRRRSSPRTRSGWSSTHSRAIGSTTR